MTVSTKISSVSYIESAAPVYPVPFRFLANEDLSVIRRTADGDELLTYAADYSVSGAGEELGGNITRLTGATVGAKLVINRNTDEIQPTNYTDGDRFPAESHEIGLDRNMLVVQEVKELASRTLQVPAGEQGIILPVIDKRKGFFLAFDANGNPIVASGTGNDANLRTDLAGAEGMRLIGGLDSLAATALAGTLADAKASNFLAANPNAQFIYIIERKCSFQRWLPAMAALPDTLEDYAWFRDLAGNRWMIQPGPANVVNFGARGDDADADTRAFFAAAAWASAGYCHHLIIPNLGVAYLLKDGLLSWYPTGAAKTELTSMSGFAGLNCGVAFIGIPGLVIEGQGFPTIKRADNGCSTNGNSWLSWGIFNFKSCTSPTIFGFEVDGNRAGQLHTTGFDFNSINHGLFFWGDCQKPTVKFMDFYNTGTLQANLDKAGDGIYMSSGTKDRTVTYCRFYNMGRMAITMERPRPGLTTDDDTTRSYRDEISHYLIDNGFNQDGAPALAGIDYEPWSTFGYVEIHHGIHKGSSKISIGSGPNVALQTVRSIHIHDLKFDLTGSTGAHDSDVLINVSSTWSNAGLGLDHTVRIYEGVTIEDIDVYSDKKLGGNVTQFANAVFRDLTVRHIRNHARDATVNAVSTIGFAGAWLEGTVNIEGNLTGQITQGIHFASFTDPTAHGYTPAPAAIFLRGNVGNGTARGIRGSLPAFPAGSSIVIGSDNRFPNQASQSDPNATAMVAVSGSTAKVLDANYFNGTGNSFNGFSTPGRGSATVAAGTSSVVVTHGLGYTPVNIQLTPKGDITPATYWWVDTIGTASFTIRTNANVTSATDFSWRAVGPGGL